MIHFIIKKGSGFLNISALPSKLRFIIILIIILQLLTTIIVLQIQYTTLKKSVGYKLSSIADTKRVEIERWIKDQIDDINLLIQSDNFNYLLYNFLNSPCHDSYTNLWKFLIFYATNNDIHDIILVIS